MKKAINKKSGREFKIVGGTPEVVDMISLDAEGEEKTIKVSTLAKNYTVVDMEEVKAPVEEQRALEEVTPEEVDELFWRALNAPEALEEEVARQAKYVAVETDVPDTIEGWITYRDNARQAFKENAVRFIKAVEELDQMEAEVQSDNPDNFYEKEKDTLRELIQKYAVKLLKYYSRYIIAKTLIDDFRLQNRDGIKE